MDRPRSAGFTLIELLVAVGIGGLVMAAISLTLTSTVRYRRDVEARLETHQGLKGAIDALGRDIRLAGSCLPPLGDNFIAIDGDDTTRGDPPLNQDQILARIGLLDENGACIRTSMIATQPAPNNTIPAGSTTIPVDDPTDFEQGMQVYLVSTGGAGEFNEVTGTRADPPAISLQTATSRVYENDSGVYALQSRSYSIAPDLAGRPILNISIDDQDDQPIALGIEQLDVEYVLEQNCPPCTVVPLPVNQAQWRLVKAIDLSFTARSPNPTTPGTLYRISEQLRVKPRNLIP